MVIKPAEELPLGLRAIRVLFLEYADSLGVDLSFQDFATELETLPGCYAGPGGGLFLALASPTAALSGADADTRQADDFSGFAGCVGVRAFGDGTDGACEMKRLYVRPAFQKLGLGKRLALTATTFARRAGYRRMRLDTLPSMRAAMGLYERLGFSVIAPYRYNPIPGTVYYEADLKDGHLPGADDITC